MSDFDQGVYERVLQTLGIFQNGWYGPYSEPLVRSLVNITLRASEEVGREMAEAARSSVPPLGPMCALCGLRPNAHSPTRTGGYLTGHAFVHPEVTS